MDPNFLGNKMFWKTNFPGNNFFQVSVNANTVNIRKCNLIFSYFTCRYQIHELWKASELLVLNVWRGGESCALWLMISRDGWTNLGETFRGCQVCPGEWPREGIFWKNWKIKKLTFLASPVGKWWRSPLGGLATRLPHAASFVKLARFWYLAPCANIYLLNC